MVARMAAFAGLQAVGRIIAVLDGASIIIFILALTIFVISLGIRSILAWIIRGNRHFF